MQKVQNLSHPCVTEINFVTPGFSVTLDKQPSRLILNLLHTKFIIELNS